MFRNTESTISTWIHAPLLYPKFRNYGSSLETRFLGTTFLNLSKASFLFSHPSR